MGEKTVLDLNLSVRARNLLMRGTIETIDQLLSLTPEDLKKMHGIGTVTYEEILNIIEMLKRNDSQAFVDNGISSIEESEESSDSHKSTLITKLPLSIRAKNQLLRYGINTMDDLIRLSQAELMGIPNLGKKTVDEILVYLEGKEINVSKALFQMVYPQLIEEDTFELLFENGLLLDDILLEKIGVSKRLFNLLKKAGYKTIREVAFADYEDLKQIPGFGNHSIEELLEYLRTHMTYNTFDNSEISIVREIAGYYSACWEEEVPEFDTSYFVAPLQSVIKELVSNNNSIITKADNFTNNERFERDCFSSNSMIEVLARYLLKSIKRDWGSIKVLEYAIPEVFVENGAFNKAINSLVDAGKVELENQRVRLVLPHIADWLATLDEKEQELLNGRFSGKTLEECGLSSGLSRERVRQITKKALRRAPVLREDDWRYWFETYCLSLEEMRTTFGVSSQAYYYFCVRYKKGPLHYKEILDDRRLSFEEYKRAEKYLKKDKIHLGVFLVEQNKEELIKALLKIQFREKSVTTDVLFDAYNRVLAKNKIVDGPLIFSSERVFQSRLPDYRFTLTTYGKKVRFFDLDHTDAVNFVENLHFKQYMNKELSTRKLFLDNEALMQEYGLQDEYELHNYLKKTENSWKPDYPFVTLSRMPTITIGKADKKKQVEELLFEVAPVSMEEFCSLYEDAYGVLAQTVQANHAKYIEKYYHQGVLTVDQPLLSDSEHERISQQLLNDFYFIEDVKKLYEREFGEKDEGRINPRVLKELGYKVYSQYIIRNTFQSAEDYFRKLLTEKPLLDMSSFDSRMSYLGAMNTTLDALKKSYDLLEYEKGKYLSFEQFHSARSDLNKTDLDDFVDKALAFASAPFFSFHSLIRDGFSHPIQNVALDEWFFSSLIKNSKKVRTIVAGGGQLHYFGNKTKMTADMIRYEIEHYKSYEINSFTNYIFEKYGLSIQRDKMIENAKKVDLYYDEIMEKIYYSKEDYYKDLD